MVTVARFPVFIFLQILDFGLARHTDDEMTGYVATRWYRAPEIMLNWMHYNQTGESGTISVLGSMYKNVISDIAINVAMTFKPLSRLLLNGIVNYS